MSTTQKFAQLFSFETAYAYNSESFAYVKCILLKPISCLNAGREVPEVIVNFKTSKIKLNVNGYIYTVPFDVTWDNGQVEKKSADEDDSDFDCDGSEGSEDSEDSGSNGSGSETTDAESESESVDADDEEDNSTDSSTDSK